MIARCTPSAFGGSSGVSMMRYWALLSRGCRSFALNFPALTGRVVDQASIIQPATRAAIEPKACRAREQVRHSARRCHRQFARRPGHRALRQRIVPQLEAWREGQKTMACCCWLRRTSSGCASKSATALRKRSPTPFRRSSSPMRSPRASRPGDFGGGISRGVDDIITVLTTDASEWQQRPSLRLDKASRPTIR